GEDPEHAERRIATSRSSAAAASNASAQPSSSGVRSRRGAAAWEAITTPAATAGFRSGRATRRHRGLDIDVHPPVAYAVRTPQPPGASMRVVLYFRIKEVRWTVGDDDLRAVQARYPQVEFVRVTEDDDLPAAVSDADVFFGFHFPPALFATARRLRWIHSAAAGVEANLFPAMVA